MWTHELTLEGSVKQAALVLDKLKPNWFELINFDTIVMWDCAKCVIGQVFDPTDLRVERDHFYDVLGHISKLGYEGFGAFSTSESIPYWKNEVSRRS